MAKMDEVRKILSSLDMPSAQQSDICCYTLLAMAAVTENSEWSAAGNEWIRIHDIIRFIGTEYKVQYAENSRETIRKQALHQFRNAAVIEDNGMATNSPNYRYRITREAIGLIKTFGGNEWNFKLLAFKENHSSLIEIYSSKKVTKKLPIQVNEKVMSFSTGKHNELQRLILVEFAPRFAPFTECLYIGDTEERDIHTDTEKLRKLGFMITLHDKMPDVILYREDKNWLYFIEAVTSVGPIDAKRILEIEEMTKGVHTGKVFVTAFLDLKTFKTFVESLAWETEVWIAEFPEHMIHMDGDKFIGPRQTKME